LELLAGIAARALDFHCNGEQDGCVKRAGAALFFVLAACSSDTTQQLPSADASPDTTSGTRTATLSTSCEVPTPCGGALAGTWTLVAACANVQEGCDPSSGYANVSGELEFKVDSASGSDLVIWQDHVDYNHCDGQGFANDDEYGIYSISGTNLVVTSSLAGGGTYEYPYCLSGDELWIASAAAVFPTLAVRYFKRK
jgi:hypothetical protein